MYLNPDPWDDLIGEANETYVNFNRERVKALIDSGAQVSQITVGLARKMGLKIKPLKRLLKLEGAGGAHVKYMGYVKAYLDIPEIRAFNYPCLFLVLRDSDYGNKCPVIIGTLHIDLILELATKEELSTLTKQWERGSVRTRIQTRLASVSGELDQIQGVIKLQNDVVLPPRSTKQVAGRSSHPIHPKRVNVIIEPTDGEEGTYTVKTYTYVKRNSQRVPLVLRNDTSREIVLTKGMRIASLSPANLEKPVSKDWEARVQKSVLESERPIVLKNTVLGNGKPDPPSPERLEKLFSKIDLSGMGDWLDSQKDKVNQLMKDYHNLFALEDKEMGKTSLVKHKIKLTDSKPFKLRHRRVPPHEYQEVKAHLKEMEEIGAIRKSHSPWSSPVVLVRKKTGELRFCIDLRTLNARTEKDAYSLPRIEDSLDSLNGAKIFSSLDLKSGYWQVELEEESIPLTAFTVGPLGFYECVRMPFGLTNAPATFQRLMENCLGDLHLRSCIIYLDDIIIYSKTPEEHVHRLSQVFEKLAAAGLKLKPSKCEFFKTEINYLGHVVSQDGIRTDDKKIEAIRNWPRPVTNTEVRSFLGFTNYYRRFIHKYSQIAKPLNLLITGDSSKHKNKKTKVSWNTECEEAFERLKEICSETPVLGYADYTKPFRLNTDASTEGLGAALYQRQEDGTERVIAFASRSLSKSERNYDAHKLEFLALKWAVTDKFHEYLYGGDFDVYTDNNPLTYVLTTAKLDATGQRWVAALANYNFDIYYRCGKTNADADALSRIPWRMFKIDEYGDTEQLVPIKQVALDRCEEEVISFSTPVLVKDLQVNFQHRLSKTEWLNEQSSDPVIGKVLNLLNKNQSHKISDLDDPEFRILWKMKGELCVENKLLYRKIFSSRLDQTIYQFVLPKSFRNRTISICHDDYGHLGIDRVTQLLQDRFFWPKMVKDVREYIMQCDRCIRFKQPTEKAPLCPLEVTYPFELIHLDFLSIGGKKDTDKEINVLVVTDHFTRYACAFVTPNQTAATVANVLVDKYFSFFGWPQQILTDQGSCFESNIFKELLHLCQVKRLRTSPYRPSTNGSCERFNLTLIRMLGTLPVEAKKKWQDWVPTLAHAYNCTVSKVTGYSPYYLLFGRLPKLPLDIEYDVTITRKKVLDKKYPQYVKNMEERLHHAYNRAQEYIDKESSRQKQYYDRNYKCSELKPGDLVLVRVKAFGSDHKIADKWEEEVYRVVFQVKNTPAYQVQNTKTLICRVVHRNYLFPLRLRKLNPEEDMQQNLQDDAGSLSSDTESE